MMSRDMIELGAGRSSLKGFPAGAGPAMLGGRRWTSGGGRQGVGRGAGLIDGSPIGFLPARHSNARRVTMNSCSRWLFCLVVAALAAGHAGLKAQDAGADARARAIVRKMTLDEKIEELHGIRDATHFRYVPPIPRLGIPALRVTNGPAGVGPDGTRPQQPATALPAPISLAASWDVRLARLYGAIIGKEARDLADGLLEGPDVNILRVPQNGRTFEAFGEDPYLVSRMAVNVIEGIQSQHVIANVKHYDANNQETNRFRVNEIIGERALHEIYLPAFAASVKQAHVASLMCAYNKVNGSYNCQNDLLLHQILKKDWDFKGFVTSDFGATHSTVRSAMAGLDLEMPTGKYFGSALKAAVQSGRVPMSVVNDKLVRRFRAMMELGVFDRPPTLHPIPAKQDGRLARQIAEQGMVLLKNQDGLLPLDASRLHSIAVIGPYAARAITGGGGSSHVVPLYTVDPVKGIEDRAGSGVKVSFNDGSDVAQAAALAKSSDVAIVMVGDYETEGRDHPISLQDNQDQLVEAVAAANPRTVVVLKSGSVILMPWVKQVPAILEAWYPGEEDGHAVAAVLFGDVNPSGKLPMTFPKQLADLPADTPGQYPGVDNVVHYSEGVFVGYRHYDADHIQPLFPFGFGLSYTTFRYQHLSVSPKTISLGEHSGQTVSIDFEVANTGRRAGAEVAELYVGFPATRVVREPPKQLKGFTKLELKPGETLRARLELNARAFSYWDVRHHRWAILPGVYKILIGSSSRDILLHGQVKIEPRRAM
jgi:beta-glucosidase